MVLPSPEWLSLSQAARYVADRCGCSEREAKDALVQAGREDRLDAKGSIPLSVHRDPTKREAHPARRYEALRDVDWNQQIDWSVGKIGPYSGVLTRQSSIESWLHQQPSAVSTPEQKPAVPYQIDEAITVAYDEAESAGKKPPNLKEIVEPVRAALRNQGLQASGRQIQHRADTDEFKKRRRKPGATVASESRRKQKP
jgi:hypothetical protein